MAPNGLEKILAIASLQPLDFNTLTRFSEGSLFGLIYQSESSFSQRIFNILSRLPQESWVSDTALFYIGDPPKVPNYGILEIDSFPSQALVYVDGQYIGQTPVNFGTFSGLHRILVGKTGFNSVETTVNLNGGQRFSYSPILEPTIVNNIGTADFISSKEGANVYVAGNYLGKTPLYGMTFFPGSYTARFVRPGYDEQTKKFDVVAQQKTSVNVELIENVQIISGRLGLKNYPEATVEKLFEDGSSVEATIVSGASLNDVYNNFHSQILAAGWVRSSSSIQQTNINQTNVAGVVLASYHRGSSFVDLTLEKQAGGKYGLSLSFFNF